MSNKYPNLQEELVIDDPEALKVIADSLRIQIIKSLGEPATVKEVAEVLEIPPTKLYYHVNLLEKHDLIQVVETNVVSGIIEKKYQVVARSYRAAQSLLTTGSEDEFSQRISNLVGAVFDTARTEMARSARAGILNLNEDNRCHRGTIWQSAFSVPEDKIDDLCQKLNALLDECTAYGEAESDDAVYGLTIAFYPMTVKKGGE